MAPVLVIALMVGAALFFSSLGSLHGVSFRRAGAKRCSRCWRRVSNLQPYVDARREIWVCRMCAAEMDIVNSTYVEPPSR